MKNFRSSSKLLTFFVAILFITGCSKKSENSLEASLNTSASYRIIPADNQTGVRLNQSIQIIFVKSVDPMVVETNFHLMSQKDISDTNCAYGKMIDHANMGISMMDSLKMNHLEKYHSTKGKFTWNNAYTAVTFSPDSMMQNYMQYMLHFGKDMMKMMQKSADTLGRMSGYSNGVQQNDMMIHFSTMDTAISTGDGHLGHH